jgi:hypothetical protein
MLKNDAGQTDEERHSSNDLSTAHNESSSSAPNPINALINVTLSHLFSLSFAVKSLESV